MTNRRHLAALVLALAACTHASPLEAAGNAMAAAGCPGVATTPTSLTFPLPDNGPTCDAAFAKALTDLGIGSALPAALDGRLTVVGPYTFSSSTGAGGRIVLTVTR